VKGANCLRDLDVGQWRAPPLGICWHTDFVRSIPMMDVVMVAIAFTFFAVSIAYVYACERL
jgi:hypothetical protein